jgi:hypothetical protein
MNSKTRKDDARTKLRPNLLRTTRKIVRTQENFKNSKRQSENRTGQSNGLNLILMGPSLPQAVLAVSLDRRRRKGEKIVSN